MHFWPFEIHCFMHAISHTQYNAFTHTVHAFTYTVHSHTHSTFPHTQYIHIHTVHSYTHSTLTHVQYIHTHTVHSHTHSTFTYSTYVSSTVSSFTVEIKHTSCTWHVLMCQSTAGESPLGNTCMPLSVSLNCAIVTTELSLLGDVQ